MRVTDTASFISKSKIVHGDRYDYSKSIYTKSHEKINIICKTHGEFSQIARDHYNGGFGCSLCSGLKRKTTDEFIQLATIKHNGKYTYPTAVYKNSKSKLKIMCPDHGEFEQSACDHLAGKGCKICANITIKRKITLSQDEFIRRSILAHGETYDYSNVIFNGLNELVEIKCKIHGSFHQRANDHQRGIGCNDCSKLINRYNRNSFIDYCLKKSGKGYLYLVKCFNENERFFKIGITSNHINKRLNKSSMPYKFELISLKNGDPEYIWNKEKSLHKDLVMFRHEPKISFNGETECFSELTSEVMEFFGVSNV